MPSPISIAPLAPLSDAVVIALGRLVDDYQQVREPSHSTLTDLMKQCRLIEGDVDKPMGKRRRVQGVLNWAMINEPTGGEQFVSKLIATLRGYGGFRPTSANFVGSEALVDAQAAFAAEGWLLSENGELGALLLDEDILGERAGAEALRRYVRRANLGARDAALVTGTGKDLLEATAAHILVSRYGTYLSRVNFPTLLGQAFVALGLATQHSKIAVGPQSRLELAYFETACAINELRNRQGVGHGRPFIPAVSDEEASAAVRTMGAIAGWLLAALDACP